MAHTSYDVANVDMMKKQTWFANIRRLTCIDWLKLIASFLVPFLLGVATIILSMQQYDLSQRNRLADLDIANRKQRQDDLLAIARRQENIFSDFKRDIWMLMTNELKGDENNELNYFLERSIHALILSSLRQLSSIAYKREIIQFLYEIELIQWEKAFTIDLKDADLAHVNFDGLHLPKIKFDNARLTNTSWVNSDLTGAHFYYADLHGANFTHCHLNRSSFILASLSNSDFQRASARYVSFVSTNLVNVDFRQTDLTGTDFGVANVTNANFDQAILLESDLTNEQLFKQAKSVHGALLPNGTLMQN